MLCGEALSARLWEALKARLPLCFEIYTYVLKQLTANLNDKLLSEELQHHFCIWVLLLPSNKTKFMVTKGNCLWYCLVSLVAMLCPTAIKADDSCFAHIWANWSVSSNHWTVSANPTNINLKSNQFWRAHSGVTKLRYNYHKCKAAPVFTIRVSPTTFSNLKFWNPFVITADVTDPSCLESLLWHRLILSVATDLNIPKARESSDNFSVVEISLAF